VKNRRDNTLVDFFKQSGVPEAQIVYLQDKQAPSSGSTARSPSN